MKLNSTPSSISGSIWYGDSSNKIEACIPNIWTWSAASNMSKGVRWNSGAGTSNAGLTFAGCSCSSIGANPEYNISTFEFNGSTWSSGGNSLRCRGGWSMGAGTQNAALVAGGRNANNCSEEYNGTSWSTAFNLIRARCDGGGSGTQNDALYVGGQFYTNGTEEYNGTAWAAGACLIYGPFFNSVTGTSNAALTTGTPSLVYDTYVQTYNGTSWSFTNPISIGTTDAQASGTQNSTLIFGGNRSGCCISLFQSQEYNGTTWSFTSPLVIPMFQHGGGSGSSTSTFAAGGVSTLNYLYNSQVYDCSPSVKVSMKCQFTPHY